MLAIVHGNGVYVRDIAPGVRTKKNGTGRGRTEQNREKQSRGVPWL